MCVVFKARDYKFYNRNDRIQPVGSITGAVQGLTFSSYSGINYADAHATVAQLVEYDLAKVGVAGSSPVCRSQKKLETLDFKGFLFLTIR